MSVAIWVIFTFSIVWAGASGESKSTISLVMKLIHKKDSLPSRWLSFMVTSLYEAEGPPQPTDVHFYLWTRSNPSEHVELLTNRSDVLKSSPFSRKKPLKVLVHGFGGNASDDFVFNAKEAYLNFSDCNVIGVDWTSFAAYPDYARAAFGTKLIGVYLAKFLDFLILAGTSDQHIHLIGYSLGAHVAGSAGNALSTGRLARITGLEPASGGFQRPRNFRPLRGLSRKDAKFVDVIHTNSNPYGLGTTGPIGHVDFYPNGGKWQAGCFWTKKYETFVHCSHARATDYFVESIGKPNGFQSIPCSSSFVFWVGLCGDCTKNPKLCVSMGEHLPASASGSYYLYTKANAPYSLD